MGINFTDEQNKAINTLDKSVLVSAAAGSGKTAVLIQRIINIILQNKADVDEMLVVTFTNNAASEMRLKLSKALKKKIKEDPANKDRYREQLSKLYKANISTFHTFASKVIKEFFYEIDMEPTFSICDDIQGTLLKREAVDNLFEEAFEKDDLIEGCSFTEFLRLYSDERTEKNIKESITDTYDKLRAIPNYWKWAEENVSTLNFDEEKFFDSKAGQLLFDYVKQILDEICSAIDALEELFNSVELGIEFDRIIGPERDDFFALKTRMEEDEQLSEDLVNDIIERCVEKFPSLTIKKANDPEEAYPRIKDGASEVRNFEKKLAGKIEKFFYPSLDVRIREMNDAYKYTIYFLNLLKAFEERFKELKKRDNLVDFSDLEHIALRILEKNEAAEILRKRFKYIFVDEYQDTNYLQDTIIGKISKKDNAFRVGDVKQSIYKFRNAEPIIFQRMYRDYSFATNTDAQTIDLNENFRTNDKTINYINKVFEGLMPNYDEKAKLYYGQEKYEDEYDFVPDVHVLYTNNENDDDSSAEEEDNLENLSNEEAEAKYVAKLVKGIVGTDFYDSSTGEIRKVEPRDITILMRSIKAKGDIYTRALQSVDIKSHVEEDEGFFDTVEVAVAVSILECIDNIQRDVPLISTLYSNVFSFTPEELSKIRIAMNETGQRRACYWEAFMYYAESGDDDKLKQKVNDAINKINEWRNLSKLIPLEDFVWKIMIESGHYMHVGTMYMGERRQANIRTFVDRTKKFSENTISSLSSFLDYIALMREKGTKNEQANVVSKDDNVVKVTTIHKSKGLEYPFVIIANIGTNFKKTNLDKKPSFDSDLGFGLHYVDKDKRYWRSTLFDYVVNEKNKSENLQEEMRILYVAMTRARNKLILVGRAKSEEKLYSSYTGKNNYLDMLVPVLDTDDKYNKFYSQNIDVKPEEVSYSRIQSVLKSREQVDESEFKDAFERVSAKLDYEYPYKAELNSRAKYSVSAIRKEMLADNAKSISLDEIAENSNENVVGEEIEQLQKQIDRDKKSNAADIGTAYHRLMEFIDFEKISKEYIEDCLKDLTEKSAIDEEISKRIDCDKIYNLFQSELGKRMVEAAKKGNLQKEKPFTLKTDWNGNEILVQGVIDCCFEENEKFILIDYKTSYVNPNKSHDDEIKRIKSEYKTQLELYSKAIVEGTGKKVEEAYLYLFNTGEAIKL